MSTRPRRKGRDLHSKQERDESRNVSEQAQTTEQFTYQTVRKIQNEINPNQDRDISI